MRAYYISNTSGTSARILFASFTVIASWSSSSPPPAEPLVSMRDARRVCVSFRFLVIAAFSWKPKTSGSGYRGKVYA